MQDAHTLINSVNFERGIVNEVKTVCFTDLFAIKQKLFKGLCKGAQVANNCLQCNMRIDNLLHVVPACGHLSDIACARANTTNETPDF